MTRRRANVFFDGGSRPNPGRMEAAVVVRGVTHLFDDMGVGTNGEAEWQALLRALEVAAAQGLVDAELVGDSRAVIARANAALGQSASRDAPDAEFLALAARARPGRIRWIKREQNLAGIALAARHPR